jgi:hypothetical protein
MKRMSISALILCVGFVSAALGPEARVRGLHSVG